MISSMPLWQCARLPKWLRSSLSSAEDPNTTILASTYQQAFTDIAGYGSALLHAMNVEDTRCALIDLCAYDAFRDTFLLQPALGSL